MVDVVSATNRGSERREADFYPTPAWCVWRLLDEVGMGLLLHGTRWLEPCVGDGAIVEACREWVRGRGLGEPLDWASLDLREVEPVTDEHYTADYLFFGGPFHTPEPTFDVCVTNPPYGLALDFAKQARADARVVCMLLRLNWLAGSERAAWLRRFPPDVYVLPNRPSFTGDGQTDATDYAWFVWGLTEGGHLTILDETPIEQRRNR